MWNLLIGLRATVSETDETGIIQTFGSEKGEKTVLLVLESGLEKQYLFSAIQIVETDFQKKIEEIDREIFTLQEKKFSLLNFFLVFPSKLIK